MYDKNNVFFKIINKEIPANIIYEDDNVLSFYDINPVCKKHALVITKKQCVDFDDFVNNSTADEVACFFKTVSKIAEMLDVKNSGYRIVSNIGANANQLVKHFHVHILGGEKLSEN